MPELLQQLPMLNFRAAMVPETIDMDKRTVEVVWTTGARGKRSGFFREYYEELAIEPENIRLDRFIGAPVLDQHQHGSVRNILGVVESAHPVKSSNGKTREWRAKVRFCDDADDVFQKVAGGFVRFVSIGYFVAKYEELEEREENDTPVFRAVDWTPAELSFVTVPFDAKASVRSYETQSSCEIILFNRSNSMPPETAEPNTTEPTPAPAASGQERQNVPAPAPEPPPADPQAPRQAERRFSLDDLHAVRLAAGVAGFKDVSSFETMLGEGKSLDEIRAAIVSEAVRRQPKIDTSSSQITVGTNLQINGIERGIQEVFLLRANSKVYADKMTDAGKRFSRDSVMRLAERLLEANGVKIDGMGKETLIRTAMKFRSGSHSVSDFFHLFESSVDRVLKDEFNRVTLTYLPFASEEEVPDFRDVHYVIVGDNFDLVRQDENEELTYGTFTTDARSFRIYKFAKGIKWTFEMMVNDDLSVLRRLPDMVTRAGEKLKARLVWGMILGDGSKIGPNGVTMSDKSPLFCASHGNIATAGGPINKTTVAAARKAIRRQRAFGGKEESDTLDLNPKYLVCGPEMEQEAIDFLAANFVAVNQTDAAAHNLTRSLTLVVENRITDNAWFLVSPDIDGIVTARLQGESGMFLDSREDWETDAYKIKGRMTFGVHMARWEGWYKNPGA